jgi:hypothetical protein
MRRKIDHAAGSLNEIHAARWAHRFFSAPIRAGSRDRDSPRFRTHWDPVGGFFYRNR